MHTWRCISCETELPESPHIECPSGGTLFSSPGNYGSRMFDPADGTTLVMVICDDCLSAKRTLVLHKRERVSMTVPIYKNWVR